MAVPDPCPKCGSTRATETPCESGPHHARRNCAECRRFLGWVAKPAPSESGETIARFPRNNGRERLRASLETYEGHPFVRLQVWQADDAGVWRPVAGKCVTIKMKETAALAEALAAVAPEPVGLVPADYEAPKDWPPQVGRSAEPADLDEPGVN